MYAVEDVGEAAIVADLLARGVRRAEIRRAIDALGDYGEWPLSEARLAVSDERRLVLREDGTSYVLTRRGWQTVVVPGESEEVRLRLRHRRRG